MTFAVIQMVSQDDVRVKLLTPISPGATARVDLRITTPSTPGLHRLQVDVVQEGVAWFATCGSEPAEVTIQVGDENPKPRTQNLEPQAPSPKPQADTDLSPVMEMHAG